VTIDAVGVRAGRRPGLPAAAWIRAGQVSTLRRLGPEGDFGEWIGCSPGSRSCRNVSRSSRCPPGALDYLCGTLIGSQLRPRGLDRCS
jgi:hypothetical protein